MVRESQPLVWKGNRKFERKRPSNGQSQLASALRCLGLGTLHVRAHAREAAGALRSRVRVETRRKPSLQFTVVFYGVNPFLL